MKIHPFLICNSHPYIAKLFYVFSFLITFCNNAFAQPVIKSVSPFSGAIGSIVKITGDNFSIIPNENIVFFGAVRATVISSDLTKIEVTVPTGLSNAPITVTTNNLTAYSSVVFNATFTGGGNKFINSSFSERIDLVTDNRPNSIVIADFNNDGKPDIAVAQDNINGSISVFKNNSSIQKMAFSPKKVFASNSLPNFLAVGDLNGDGKPDLVSTSHKCKSNCTVYVFINTSIDSNVVFANPIEFSCTETPSNPIIHDIDGDGKPDIIMLSEAVSPVFSVLRNTTTGNNISFAPKVDFPKLLAVNNYNIDVMIVADLDGDGKPDIAITPNNDSVVSTFRNTSSAGLISFAPRVDFGINYRPMALASGDLDQDGKMDLVTFNEFPITGSSSVLKNNSRIGNISFTGTLNQDTHVFPFTLNIFDLNGDGKPDLSLESYQSNDVRLFINNTQDVAKISGGSWIIYKVGFTPWGVYVGDFNNDGKPDMVTSNLDGSTITVLKNTSGESITTRLCPPSASTAFFSNLDGTTYQWQLSTDSVVFKNIANSSVYSGSSTNQLQLNNFPSSWYGYQYKCLVDGVYANIFTLKFESTWTGSVDSNWENAANWSCGKVPDGFTDLDIPMGKTVTISSNVTCRTLHLQAGSILNVLPGFTLTITK